MGFPEIALGLLPGAGGTQRAPRVMDAGEAFTLINSGKPIPARRAMDLGLIDRLAGDDLVANAIAYARKLLGTGAPARRVRDEPAKVADPSALEAALMICSSSSR